MTNYDHLIEGGIDALIGKNFSGADCECCVCLVGEDCVYSGEECARAIKQWLEAEHVEPDSWDRLEADSDKIVRDAYRKTQDGALIMIPLPDFETIIERAKKLAGWNDVDRKIDVRDYAAGLCVRICCRRSCRSGD